jgi:type I restriction enzyme M protein
VLAHGGRIGDVSIYGQESNHTTWRLAMMNLAIRGIEADITWNEGGSFLQDAHPDLKADFILANPPFNDSEWGGEGLRNDKRWQFGIPPAGNSNYAWMEHFVYHLAPTGVAAFVMANGSMSSNQSGEGDIRKALIEAPNGGLVDCMIALPGQLFYTTQIPVCVWILARDRRNHKFRDRSGEILFIDARKMGEMTDRTHKTLRDEDIAKIAGAYHAWRTTNGAYADVPGFCKAAALDEVRKHGHVLTPGRYVGTEELEDDGEPFEDRMSRLTSLLHEQQVESLRLDADITDALRKIGYG